MSRCSLKILLLCLAWLCQASSLFGQVFIDGPEEVRAGEEFTFRALEQLPDGTTKAVSPSRYTISVRYSGSTRFESLQVGRGYQIPDGHHAVDFGSGSSWAYSGWFDGFTKDFTLNISVTGSQAASKSITFRTGYLPPPWDSLMIEGPSVLPVGNDLTGNKGEFRLMARVAGGQEQDVSSYAEWKVKKGSADVSAEYSKSSRLLTVRESSFTPGSGRLLEVKYPGTSTLTKQVGFEAAASPKKFTRMEVLLEQKAPAPAVVKPKPGAKPKPRPVVVKPTKPTFQPLPVAAGESLKLTENQQARFRVRVWYDDGSFRYLESTYASSATAQDPYFFEWLQERYDYRAPSFIDKRASTGVLNIGVWTPGFDTFTLGLNAYDPYKAYWTGSGAIQWNQPIRIVPAVIPVSLKITNQPQVAVLDENTSWSFGAVAMMSDGSQQDVRSLTTFTPSDGKAAVSDPNVRGKIYLKPLDADREITLFASANVLGKALNTNIPLVVHDRGPDLPWPDPPVYSKLFSHTDGQSLTAGTFVQFRVEEALGVTTQVMVGSRFGYPDILNDVVPWNRNVGSLIQIPDQARDLWVSVRSLRYGSIIHEENYRLPIRPAAAEAPKEDTTGFRIVQERLLSVDERRPHSSAPEEKQYGLLSRDEVVQQARIQSEKTYPPIPFESSKINGSVRFVLESLGFAAPLTEEIKSPYVLFGFFEWLKAQGSQVEVYRIPDHQRSNPSASIPHGAVVFYMEPTIGALSWRVTDYAQRAIGISKRAFGHCGIADGPVHDDGSGIIGGIWTVDDETGLAGVKPSINNLYQAYLSTPGQFVYGWVPSDMFFQFWKPELISAYKKSLARLEDGSTVDLSEGEARKYLSPRLGWAKAATVIPRPAVVRPSFNGLSSSTIRLTDVNTPDEVLLFVHTHTPVTYPSGGVSLYATDDGRLKFQELPAVNGSGIGTFEAQISDTIRNESRVVHGLTTTLTLGTGGWLQMPLGGDVLAAIQGVNLRLSGTTFSCQSGNNRITVYGDNSYWIEGDRNSVALALGMVWRAMKESASELGMTAGGTVAGAGKGMLDFVGFSLALIGDAILSVDYIGDAGLTRFWMQKSQEIDELLWEMGVPVEDASYIIGSLAGPLLVPGGILRISRTGAGIAIQSETGILRTVSTTELRTTAIESKVIWGFWTDYQKVIINGQEYALIGSRLFTSHAVNRMNPSGYGSVAGVANSRGRSISPNFVEHVIRDGDATPQVVDGVVRTIHRSGTVEVVTEDNARIVITIITK
jgi:hypothetical protein